MRCKAIAIGFHDGARVRPGQIVTIAGKKVPKWCVKIEDPKTREKAPAQVPQEPEGGDPGGDGQQDLSLV